MKVVFDTNILVAAVKSRRGASFKLLSMISNKRFCYALSVPLLLEYEDVLNRKELGIAFIEKCKKSDLVPILFFCRTSADLFFMEAVFKKFKRRYGIGISGRVK